MTAQPQTPLHALRRHRLLIGSILGVSAVIYAVVGQLAGFRQAVQVLQSDTVGIFGLAVGCLVISWVAAATIYQLLSFRPLRFGRTILVQIASSGAGRALPAGIGSLGVSYLYLRRNGASEGIASSQVALNNGLGFAGHAILFSVLLFVIPGQKLHLAFSAHWLVISGAIVGVAIGTILLWRYGRRWLRDVRGLVRQYRRQPWRIVGALGFSMVLTICNIIILWLAARAAGVPLSLLTAMLALTLGVAAQTATPTPGGLGGVEAGIVAVLVGNTVGLPNAIATALVFRLVTFWVPLLVGLPMLVLVSRRRFI